MLQHGLFPNFPILPKLQDTEPIQAAAPAQLGGGLALPQVQLTPEMFIVASVAIGAVLFLFYVITLHRALHQSLKNSAHIKDLYAATYVSDQLREYMILFTELTSTHDEQDLINTRTQIFNFLNRISRQICESKDEALAFKLADTFFSKIEGRYVKMTPIPEGVIYFRTVAELLLASDGRLFGDSLVRHIRNEYKQGVDRQKRITPEPKNIFSLRGKEKVKKA